DLVYLGTTVSEIRVPATFRYHLRLSDPWRLATHGNVCIVRCPAIRPSLPPATDTTQMQKRSESGWAQFNQNENLAELERSSQRGWQARHRIVFRGATRLIDRRQWRALERTEQ